MTRAKRPLASLIISFIFLAISGIVVWRIPPINIWVELGVGCLLTFTLILTVSWLTGSAKRGVQIALALVGLLVMSRLGILDWPTFGLWLVVAGLLSLIT